MKKIVRLTEKEVTNLIKNIIREMSEDPKPKLINRLYTIDTTDYTLSIQDKNNRYPKIKLSAEVPILGSVPVNVVNIQKIDDSNYKIITKKKKEYELSKKTVEKIISFVDTNIPNTIKLDGATLNLKKVEKS